MINRNYLNRPPRPYPFTILKTAAGILGAGFVLAVIILVVKLC